MRTDRAARRQGLASRLMLAQVLVVVASILTAGVVALFVGPPLFPAHLLEAGPPANGPEGVETDEATHTTGTLERADVSSKLKGLTGRGYVIGRLTLGAGQACVHTRDASDPIGIQVLGYGDNTSYQYPGGLNLSSISAIPVK